MANVDLETKIVIITGEHEEKKSLNTFNPNESLSLVIHHRFL
jgi:hypothetical protein